MSGICRNSVDSAGGALENTQGTVFANGAEVIVDGDSVANHGDTPHNSASIVAGSNNVFIGGIPVCNAGDVATCGHVATGSGDVLVGD